MDSDGATLKFMELKTKDPMQYVWPENEKTYMHPIDDIVCVVDPPEVEFIKRSQVYKFKESDILKVQNHLQGQAEDKVADKVAFK